MKKNRAVLIYAAIFSLLLGCERWHKRWYPYQDPYLPIDRRVEDLVSRMTLEEKVSQMRYDAPSIERLGIPQYNWWNECLHGVARAGRATVFPQSIGLAASWDTDLVFRVATAISDEARAKHHEFVRRGKRGIYQGLTFWSPNINIFRDPRWGRGMETYGEDPYLTARIGIQFVKGLQGSDPKYLKTVSTVKHYAVHSGPEPNRHTFDAWIDERDLRETYLEPFRACIEEGWAYSVMCAYNRFMGSPCCGSSRLLRKILREEWGFNGYVVSDCWAIADFYENHRVVDSPIEAGALAVESGTDLNCGVVYRDLAEAVREGILDEKKIDISVKRLFKARMKLGMFDPPWMVGYSTIPYYIVDCRRHRRLALEAARKSIVLLKNDKEFLPLSKKVKKIAVIGPNGNDVDVLLGNYNGTPSNPVTILDGIKNKVSKDTEVVFSRGCNLARGMISLDPVPSDVLFTTDGSRRVNGLRGEYFNNRNFRGKPVCIRTDRNIDFNWWDGSPFRGLDDDDFSIRWEGELVVPASGLYAIGGEGMSGFRIFLNDSLLVSFRSRHQSVKVYRNVYLKADERYAIKIEYFEEQGSANFRLLWGIYDRNLEEEAVEIAKRADVVIMVLGLSPRLEGEEMKIDIEGFKGGDRVNLRLPDVQERLLKKIYEVNRNVVLVLMNGSALAVNWADRNIPAIVEAWYPGQAGGDAVADVLFGDYNPAGRLPVTFYRSIDQVPPFSDYSMKGRTYRYFRGYPLYPFGHGLSYSKFKYSNLKLPQQITANEELVVSVDVENIGRLDGEEVVELYVTDCKASVSVPIRSLQGFRRIFLKSGEKRRIRFRLKPKQISIIDDSYNRVVEQGMFKISIGGKQPGFFGNADAKSTEVLTAYFEVVGGGDKN